MSQHPVGAAEDDPREALERGIAELLAELSTATVMPAGVTPSTSPLTADAVRFTDTSWLSHLVDNQGWLRLTPRLQVQATVEEFLCLLGQGLGFEDPQQAIEGTGGGSRLSFIGLERLNDRAERAVVLQRMFDEAAEQGDSVHAASLQWQEAWNAAPEDNESDEEEPATGPVTATADIWPIMNFSGHAEDGRLNLSPSYQRDDVWATKDSQMLIESILRGIPLPSIIVLKPELPDAPYEVVDGKQRLTSILRFIGRHPHAVSHVEQTEARYPNSDLLSLFQNDYPRFRRAWKNHTGQQLTATVERDLHFPFKLRAESRALRGGLEHLQGKYYTQIKREQIQIAETRYEVRHVFERVTNYKIPVIEYSQATRRQIHEVFNLYNRQGVQLNAEEIRNAVHHHLPLVPGLLITAGDSEPMHVVAPFLAPAWGKLSLVGPALQDYGFGTSRYRRTKVLTWIAALLLHDTPKQQSTAHHLDSFFEAVEGDPAGPTPLLRREDVVIEALLLLAEGIEAHGAVPGAWGPSLSIGSKWQELSLVATLVGVTIGATLHGADTVNVLEKHQDEMKQAARGWKRLENAQTSSQWGFIKQVALGVAEVLHADLDEASRQLDARFGSSGIKTLRRERH
ncbi:uncharacterized protein DUF262 [Motilibacter peucedani]|uniref:Uncharacterized protein DUF262 n=1 Tax=Motilibacter peucedani TaxID=598650 RepID=A0A420XRH0_9ACTN|nr:DUF262 domain-containing protein [Motilibacter peucedani]RKS77496.1 uncharacterized protein DUF262 [Motilibacter peucedani]